MDTLGTIGRRESHGYRVDRAAFLAGYQHDRSRRWWRYPGPQRNEDAFVQAAHDAIADAARSVLA